MSQEKLEILGMLKEGKITSEEALALLKAVPDEDDRPQREPRDEGDQRPPQLPFNMDFSWLSDLRSAVEESARGLFPDVFITSQRQETFTASASFTSEPCSLVFEGRNAPIKLETYGGEQIEVEAYYRTRGQWDPHLTLSEDNHILTLRYDESTLHMLGINIRVPEGAQFEAVSLKTKNSSVSVSGVEAQKMELDTKNSPIAVSHVKGNALYCVTKNSSITLKDVRMETVDARTANSNITLRDVDADRACLVTSNSRIDVEESDILQLYARTANSPLRFERLSFRRAGQVRSISAVTTNGQISLQIPGPEVKCKLRASTTNNRVFTELDDLEYQVNEKNYVEAHTRGFETAANQLDLNLQTTQFGIYLQR